MQEVYENVICSVASFRAWVDTELGSARFPNHGGGSCVPCTPLTIVEFLNGPFTRQLSTCSHFSPSLAPSVMHSCFRPSFCCCCLTVKGEVLSLLIEKELIQSLDVIDLTFHLYKVAERILAMMGDEKRKRKHGTMLLLTIGTVHSASAFMTVTDWPQMLVFSMVLQPETQPLPL